MFKARINADVLKDAVDAATALVDEGRLHISAEGVSLKAVDPANVAMVSMSLGTDAFESFEGTDGEIGLDLIKLSDILGMADKKDIVDIELDEETHKLKLYFGGLSYTMSLLDPGSIRKEPRVPQLDLPAEIKMEGREFQRAVRAAEKISDHMALGVTEEMFYVEAEGDTDKVRLDLSKDELIGLKPGTARSLFSLDYLGSMAKVIGKADAVTIDLGVDYPMKMGFKISEGKGEINYLLAPRIESD